MLSWHVLSSTVTSSTNGKKSSLGECESGEELAQAQQADESCPRMCRGFGREIVQEKTHHSALTVHDFTHVGL